MEGFVSERKNCAVERHAGGFSFVEVMIVVVILAAGIIPLYQTMIRTSQVVRFNRKRTMAAAMSAAVAERYRALDWDALAAFCKDSSSMDELLNSKEEGDPLLCPWNNEELKNALSQASGGDDKGKSLPQLLDLFKAEARKYKRVMVFRKYDRTQSSNPLDLYKLWVDVYYKEKVPGREKWQEAKRKALTILVLVDTHLPTGVPRGR